MIRTEGGDGVACEECGAPNPTWWSDDRTRGMCGDCIDAEWLEWAITSGDQFAMTIAALKATPTGDKLDV